MSPEHVVVVLHIVLVEQHVELLEHQGVLQVGVTVTARSGVIHSLLVTSSSMAATG